MSSPFALFGYGFSPQGRDADWEDIEADLPARGPDCPPTADYLDLALGQASSQTEASLRAHLQGGCPYCQGRFEAQQRAVGMSRTLAAAAPPRAAVVAELRSRRAAVCAGNLQRLPAAWKGDTAGPLPIDYQVTLAFPPDSHRPTLQAYVQLSRRGPHGSPWYVAVRLPSFTSDQHHGNAPADLDALDGHLVRLLLIGRDAKTSCPVETRLDWDSRQEQLVSHPERMPLIADPPDVTRIECSVVQRIEDLDLS
jgi:hypothetical protein